MKQIWFVTGSSRGFGRALVRAALEAGDLVAATARRPEQLADLSAEYGDSIHPIALDVTDAAAARAAITEARERLGRLDVIVNNEQGGGIVMQFSADASAARPASPPTRPPSSPSTASAACSAPRPPRSA